MTKDTGILNKKLILAAIQALKAMIKAREEDESKKKELLEDETSNYVFLQVQLKKIPKTKRRIIRIKVKLPNSLVDESSDVCLIVGDLDKKNKKADVEPDRLHYRGLLKEHEINNIAEVLTLRQLRTEYKTYEAKQKLLAAYDVFLADNRIVECLPKELGRHFFKKRKFPVGISMKTSNLKDQIDNALSAHIFQVTGTGNSCSSEVAVLTMEDEKIYENIAATVHALSQQLPGSVENVLSMFLKAKKSKAFPFYMAYDNPNDVQVHGKPETCDFVEDEITTLPKVTHVRVYKDGKVETVQRKSSTKRKTKKNSGGKRMKIQIADEPSSKKQKIKRIKVVGKETQCDETPQLENEVIGTADINITSSKKRVSSSLDNIQETLPKKKKLIDGKQMQKENKSVKNVVIESGKLENVLKSVQTEEKMSIKRAKKLRKMKRLTKSQMEKNALHRRKK